MKNTVNNIEFLLNLNFLTEWFPPLPLYFYTFALLIWRYLVGIWHDLKFNRLHIGLQSIVIRRDTKHFVV